MKLGMKEFIIEVFKGTSKKDVRYALEIQNIEVGRIKKVEEKIKKEKKGKK